MTWDQITTLGLAGLGLTTSLGAIAHGVLLDRRVERRRAADDARRRAALQLQMGVPLNGVAPSRPFGFALREGR